MFNSVVLDVVIGLVFIYLLYSLLATIIQEIIATYIGLRARTLKKGIARMLDDEKVNDLDDEKVNNLDDEKVNNKVNSKDNDQLSKAFYAHPLIKYLGENKTHSKPAYLTAQNFSKVMIDLLRGDNVQPGQDYNLDIKRALKNGKTLWGSGTKISKDTLTFLASIWTDSQGDVVKFQGHLEKWFDDTMERASGWYKRKIQMILLVIGFLIAWFFCADTFVIIKNLSNDKGARDQIVSMANAYVQNNKIAIDTLKIKNAAELKDYRDRLDSLLAIKNQLNTDISKANFILGIGGWLPDRVKVNTNIKSKKRTYYPQIDAKSLSCEDKKIANGIIWFSCGEKWCYFFRLLYYHFFGFLITALAISLGAPFWFDLLNKLMKLRSSQKESTNSSGTSNSNNTVTALKREA
jgi:hypothetical protein